MLKLYNFGEWKANKRTVQLSEWETDEVIFKREFLKINEGWFVIDVGSEYGYYTIKAGYKVGNMGKVLAIEPHPETFTLLEMNIKLHKLSDRVIPIQRAVGKERGRTKLFETISPGGTSILPRQNLFSLNRNRLLMWLEFVKNGYIFNVFRKRYAPVKYEVMVETLDDMARDYELRKIDLIKIDVEGAELDVLLGSRDILEKHKPVLLVEVHFGCDWKPKTLYDLLRSFGYSLTIEKRIHKALVVARPKENHVRH
jgi:FkbM family methyltransferase